MPTRKPVSVMDRIVRNKTNYTALITSGENVFREMRRKKRGGVGGSNCLFSFLLQYGGTHRKRNIMKC